MLQAIAFDLGGVLVDWNPRHLFRKVFADAAAMERFLAEVCNAAWNEKQDEGRPFTDAIAERIALFPQHERHIRLYFERWPEMLAGAIEGTVAVLREVKERGLPVYALSNWSHETFPFVRERFAFLDWFDGLVVSGHVKLIKPDRRIFEHLLSRFELRPETTLFIDDVSKNTDAAAALGFATHHFHSPEDLRADLAARGVLERG